jgi:hypothetical protein
MGARTQGNDKNEIADQLAREGFSNPFTGS